jgi:SAM-dependent methyltransferase
MSDYSLRLDEREVERYRFMAALARSDEASDWAAAGVGPGARVADVGCGPGAMTAVLAELVGPGGAVVGVDAEPDTVARATEMVAGLPQASATVGQADGSGLDPGTFDVAMCRHVLAHNGGRERAIVDHLATLVRPGGAVYLVDVDIPSASVRPEPEGFDFFQAYAAFHAARGNDLRVGLRLGDLLETAGLAVERYRAAGQVMRLPEGVRPPVWAAREAMLAEGAATQSDVDRWEAAFDRIDAAETRPWMYMPVFLAVGRRPG